MKIKNTKIPASDLETLMPLLIGAWRRLHKESGPFERLQTREFRSVVNAVKTLQDGLENGKTLVGQDYFKNQELLGAYLLYQWVLHYQQGLSLINELPVTPRRVLDVCSGPGAFAFAALKHGASEVFATDRSNEALQLCAEVCGRYGMPLSVRHWNCLSSPIPAEGNFDLIIVGHCLEELFPELLPGWEDKQNQFLDYLLRRLTKDGYLLLVESSQPHVNNRILKIRDFLVNKGVPVQAPCIWKGPCPVLQTKGNPCYAQREFDKPELIKEIQRGASINLGSLKMSYIIFKSPQAQWPIPEKQNLFRIISPPVETHHGKRFYICGSTGKKNLGTNVQQQTKGSKAFDYLRRGELISIENAFEKQHSLDIVEGTKISVEAACGKPLPEVVEKEEWE